jgi:CDGSH-type Zn-finger protein
MLHCHQFPVYVAALLMASCGQQKPTPDHLFEMRSQCSSVANAFGDRIRRSDRPAGAVLAQPSKGVNENLEFVNHYDAVNNRCYVEMVGVDKDSVSVREVFDAQERKLIVRCALYVGSSGLKPTCDKSGGAEISLQEATKTANTLMDESLQWPQ